MSDRNKQSVFAPFALGVVGGLLAAGAIMAIVAAAGDIGSHTSTKTVTVLAPSPTSVSNASESARAPSIHQIYERDSPGVVLVTAAGVVSQPSASEFARGESPSQGTATGSGFEIDGAGDILTDWHVVKGAATVTVTIGEHGTPRRAKVLGQDAAHDLVLLRIPTVGLTLRPIALGDSRAVKVGDAVLAIGSPYGYGQTLTNGIVSALGRDIQTPGGSTISEAIQTDAPINPGSSGGPLLNAQGQVIGLNSQIVTSSSAGGNVGIGFAIPIDAAKSELRALERG